VDLRVVRQPVVPYSAESLAEVDRFESGPEHLLSDHDGLAVVILSGRPGMRSCTRFPTAWPGGALAVVTDATRAAQPRAGDPARQEPSPIAAIPTSLGGSPSACQKIRLGKSRPITATTDRART
jgi:hypothetical protein